MTSNCTQPDLTPSGVFVNGALSTTLALGSTQPFTTIKTLSQFGSPDISCKNLSPLLKIKKLYAGFCPNALSGALAEGTAFSVYSMGKKRLQDDQGKLSAIKNVCLSSLAGLFGSPFNASLERVMIWQQLRGGALKTHLKDIYKSEGIFRGLFKGTTATASRDIGFNLGLFALNDTAKEKLQPHIKNDFIRDIFAGLSAGAIAGLFTNPFDRSKTLIQGCDVNGKYKNLRSTFKIIIQEEGLIGLFKGAIPRTATIGSLICCAALLKARIPNFLPESLKI
jgi:solute carrier family 25 citrate transporter 1